MAGIATNTSLELRKRISEFNPAYMQHWDDWLKTPNNQRPLALKSTLGRWQACRGNPLRQLSTTAPITHPSPYLDDLYNQALPQLKILSKFDMSTTASFTPLTIKALHELWKIFENLSYQRNNPNRKKKAPRQGLAGIVGISKAVMLATDGRVGPAFDSKVRDELLFGKKIESSSDWIDALRIACADISQFEKKNNVTLQSATGINLHAGRIHDMALGPKKV